MLAFKSVTQSYGPTPEIQRLLEISHQMVNDCIAIGLSYNATALKRLSVVSWPQRRQYNCPGYCKVCAVSRAAGILATRKKSLRRGISNKSPYCIRPRLTAYQGFKIDSRTLRIPLGKRGFHYLPLTKHCTSILWDPTVKIRSFTLTPMSLSICVSKDVQDIERTGTIGIDRNLRNLTVGNEDRIVQYDLSDAVKIAETSTRIMGSFKRNDSRIRGEIASKYGRRRRQRTQHLLHNATKRIVAEAVERKQAIVLENIEGIRQIHHRGNGQGPRYRGRMNSWSFGEVQRQIEYKARWAGLPVVRLSKRKTKSTSVTCPQCGERLQEDKQLERKLWCHKCRVMMDRDVVAAQYFPTWTIEVRPFTSSVWAERRSN